MTILAQILGANRNIGANGNIGSFALPADLTASRKEIKTRVWDPCRCLTFDYAFDMDIRE